MELLKDFKLYEECKNALIESYGYVDIAKKKLKSSKYSHINEAVLEENLQSIKEGLGDKIINFFSKKLGGDISKLDKIIADMKDEEINFIKSENDAEAKFYKLTAAVAHLKKAGASKDEQNIILVKLSKFQKLIKDLVSSHNSIMDDLEKQVNIITKGSDRKAEYYNLKRAEDSVETKKMRAEFKKKLVSEEDDNEYLKDIQKILGKPEDAQKDLEKAENTLTKEKEKIGAVEETTKGSKEEIEKIIQSFNEEIQEILQSAREYAEDTLNTIKDLEDNKRMNKGVYLSMKHKFETKVEKAKDNAEKAIGKVAQVQAEDNDLIHDKDKVIKHLIMFKKEADEVKYYEWPATTELEKQKKEINKKLEELESKKLAA
jgi:hypothetical protein